MDILTLFDGLIENLKVSNAKEIKDRRDEITKALNQAFRGNDSTSDNRLMVGSWGRNTAINGVSDLDLIYVLPSSLRDDYRKSGGPRKALEAAKYAIAEHYSTSEIRVDRLVVSLKFTNYLFEIQPVFETESGDFEYPDTYSDSWKITKPRAEIQAMKNINESTEGDARLLCRLARAWKNKNDVPMGGLLIDTLVHRFLTSTDLYSPEAALFETVRDFFKYLSELPKQSNFNALGSNQKVKVKKNFQGKAKHAYGLCVDAIEAEGKASMVSKWKKVFGKFVPSCYELERSKIYDDYIDTEEFVEDLYEINIRYEIVIDCLVTQNGFRPDHLKDMLRDHIWLRPRKKLDFKVVNCTVPEPFIVKWKVLNRGEEAMRRNEIRGQIINGKRDRQHTENTKFRGEHYVECYAIKDDEVVARARIDVPIQEFS